MSQRCFIAVFIVLFLRVCLYNVGQMQRDVEQLTLLGHALVVPQSHERRFTLGRAVADYVAREKLVPPLTDNELASHVHGLVANFAVEQGELAFAAVLLNNAVWMDVVVAIPFERRLLLLPQCLAHTETCRAERDALGLICAQCGACAIGTLQAEADRLGYVSLVAEGTTVVTKLLVSGKVDAVIGVGCLDSLRRMFPIMNAHAIPGLGIPLLTDGCHHTKIDLEWTLSLLRLGEAGGGSSVTEIESVSEQVNSWFTEEGLVTLMGKPETEAERIGHEWLLNGGKRWRPLLTVAVNDASEGDYSKIIPAALAVECFHKASLIHDDIEDNDSQRYGLPTVHCRYGVPAAINAGDYLIGEGYRLLAESDFSERIRSGMVLAAAHGHRALCLGQGEELAFSRNPSPVTEATVLRIYERKTAAAFEVAVLVGAIAAGVDQETCLRLSEFSRAVGTAYQIRDDMEDFYSVEGRAADLLSMRPTIFLAVACASEDPNVVQTLRTVWQDGREGAQRLIDTIAENGLNERVNLLYEHYRHETERVIAGIQHTGLKRLLRRIMARMLR